MPRIYRAAAIGYHRRSSPYWLFVISVAILRPAVINTPQHCYITLYTLLSITRVRATNGVCIASASSRRRYYSWFTPRYYRLRLRLATWFVIFIIGFMTPHGIRLRLPVVVIATRRRRHTLPVLWRFTALFATVYGLLPLLSSCHQFGCCCRCDVIYRAIISLPLLHFASSRTYTCFIT